MSTTALPRDQLERLIRANYEDRRREDIPAVLDAFAPHACFRIVADPSLGMPYDPVTGHDTLRALFTDLFAAWDWVDFPIRDVLIDGNRAAVHSGGTMRHTPSGTQVVLETLDLLTFEDGKIVEFVEFFDTLGVARFLDLHPD